MQYEVKNLISGLASWSGLSGPIPNTEELRKKREQARLATLAAHAHGNVTEGLRPVTPPQPTK
jgi:hypothetical protein